jgi:hypothetical protein
MFHYFSLHHKTKEKVQTNWEVEIFFIKKKGVYTFQYPDKSCLKVCKIVNKKLAKLIVKKFATLLVEIFGK